MDEVFKNTAYKIFELFLDHPRKLFSVRAMARELGITHATVSNHITGLSALGLVKKTSGTYPLYSANEHSARYREYVRLRAAFEADMEKVEKRNKGYIL